MAIKSDGNGLWKTSVSYGQALLGSLPFIGLSVSISRLTDDVNARIWNPSGTDERARLLKRQCVHAVCGIVSSLLTLALTVALVSKGILTNRKFVKAVCSGSVGCGFIFFKVTDWSPCRTLFA